MPAARVGIMTYFIVPATPPSATAPCEIPMQALIGDMLTPLWTMEVRS